MSESTEKRKVEIAELAERIGRHQSAIRHWENRGYIPATLLPSRDERNRRYWPEARAEKFVAWVERQRALGPSSVINELSPDRLYNRVAAMDRRYPPEKRKYEQKVNRDRKTS